MYIDPQGYSALVSKVPDCDGSMHVHVRMWNDGIANDIFQVLRPSRSFSFEMRSGLFGDLDCIQAFCLWRRGVGGSLVELTLNSSKHSAFGVTSNVPPGRASRRRLGPWAKSRPPSGHLLALSRWLQLEMTRWAIKASNKQSIFV